MLVPKREELNLGNSREESIRVHYPEFYEYLMKTYPEDLLFKERLYWYYNGLTERPICHNPNCQNHPGFLTLNRGYKTYCSKKCLNTDPDKQALVKKICMEKFGGVAPACSKEVQNKMIETNKQRFGVEYAIQNPDVHNKMFQTNIQRYGNAVPSKTDYIKSKTTKTCLERYGYENPSLVPEFKQKILDTFHKTHPDIKTPVQSPLAQENLHKYWAEKVKDKYNVVVNEDEDRLYICQCPHKDCNRCSEKIYKVKPSVFFDRRRDHTEPCTNLLPMQSTSISNTTLEQYIKSILNSYHIEYQTNTRSIIPPKELDIYIPSHHIAIECNGVYWHSEKYKDANYHYNKWKMCEDNGIQLIQIWEDQVVRSMDIIESIICSKLGIYKERIGARQCTIKCISAKESNEFLNQNHIQGDCKANIRYGMYYNDKLVATMAFRKCKNNLQGKGDWELIRFCSRCNLQIIGGAEKMLKHFIKDINPQNIISFSSNDISNGNLYKKLGFEKVNVNQSYWYVERSTMKRYHRSTFTKDAIVGFGWRENKDGWREKDVMKEHGYFQLYDSGQTKWILK